MKIIQILSNKLTVDKQLLELNLENELNDISPNPEKIETILDGIVATNLKIDLWNKYTENIVKAYGRTSDQSDE